MSLSVLLSVYQKENPAYLEQSLMSIYDEQTLKPDEIVLVKDGLLTVELDEIIIKWQKKLNDIFKVISLVNNVGLAKALNVGIKYCTCDYIARMDTDDITMPQRFEKQILFMKKEDIDMCGTNAYLIDSESNIVGNKLVGNNITFDTLLNKCDIIHPSTMFIKDFFKRFGKYNEDFKKSQDYELWLRASNEGAKIKNLEEKLLKFRISDDLILRRKNEQKYNMMIKKEYIKGLKYYIKIVPNILILILPVFVLDILLKIKSR
jgi:glycosyltransferase involved in cell wall biosynthesis